LHFERSEESVSYLLVTKKEKIIFMIWNEKVECASRDEMAAIQSERLKQTVQRIYHNIPSYRAKMQEIGMLPGDVRSIDDLKKLPFTNKTDLRDNYPFGMFTVPMSEIVRVHASSGTTGKPVTPATI